MHLIILFIVQGMVLEEYIVYLNIWWTTKLNGATPLLSTLNVSGSTTLQSNFNCGGGIAIYGSNAFYAVVDIVDAVNQTNTCINLKQAGTSDDWCYLRQISNT